MLNKAVSGQHFVTDGIATQSLLRVDRSVDGISRGFSALIDARLQLAKLWVTLRVCVQLPEGEYPAPDRILLQESRQM
jgi:hypothetical protein